jgi:hypothetical protein
VRHQDKRHAGVGIEILQNLAKGLQPSGRCAEPHDGVEKGRSLLLLGARFHIKIELSGSEFALSRLRPLEFVLVGLMRIGPSALIVLTGNSGTGWLRILAIILCPWLCAAALRFGFVFRHRSFTRTALRIYLLVLHRSF